MSAIVQQPAYLPISFTLGESFLLPLTFQTKDQDGVIAPMDLTGAVFTARVYYGKGIAVQLDCEVLGSSVTIDLSSLTDPSYNSYDLLMEQASVKRVVLRGVLNLGVGGGDPSVVSRNTFNLPVTP